MISLGLATGVQTWLWTDPSPDHPLGYFLSLLYAVCFWPKPDLQELEKLWKFKLIINTSRIFSISRISHNYNSGLLLWKKLMHQIWFSGSDLLPRSKWTPAEAAMWPSALTGVETKISNHQIVSEKVWRAGICKLSECCWSWSPFQKHLTLKWVHVNKPKWTLIFH